MEKKYLKVLAEFDTDGNIMPRYVIFSNETIMEVKVLKINPAPSLKIGGQGDRYTCRFVNKMGNFKDAYLFLERGNKWFLEPIQPTSRL